ncbi:MAG: serine hydrolase [Chloroflexota bacterium]|nr:serine hydrolase [Chloroflexota bacterium]
MPDYRILTDYLRRWLAAVPAAGLAVSVTDRRRTLYVGGLGHADLAARRPVTAGTTFQIGSIGKSMTALAVLQLVQSGRLDLDAPVSTHLPWFAMPSRYGPITLRHLLSHTAGLPAGTDFTPAARYEGFALRETEAAWEPGSRFHYSNTGYKLLGWLLEDITGQDYGSVIRRRVLEPLGMAATEPVITHATRHRMAAGYVPLHDDRPCRLSDTLIPATWMEYPVGDGSQASTAADMARYARVWLNGGRGDAGAVASPAMHSMMTTPAISMSRGDAYQHDYGYGFGIISHQADGHHFVGHGGSTVGFRAIMLTDQTDGLGVVMLCNGSDVDTYAPARYALQFAAAIGNGQPAPEPPEIPDPTRVADAQRYAGTYVDERSGNSLCVNAEGDRLMVNRPVGADIMLEHISGNAFCAPHDDFDPFPLRFGSREDGDDAPMVEIHHGPAVYVREGSAPLAVEAPCPPEWGAFSGHYRSHAPYVSNFRVILRRGRLYLAWPNGGEEPLTPHPSDSGPSPRFLVGPPGEPTAEWLRFDPVVGSRALRILWAGGGSFYRV